MCKRVNEEVVNLVGAYIRDGYIEPPADSTHGE